jgi:hypothetical protein
MTDRSDLFPIDLAQKIICSVTLRRDERELLHQHIKSGCGNPHRSHIRASPVQTKQSQVAGTPVRAEDHVTLSHDKYLAAAFEHHSRRSSHTIT